MPIIHFSKINHINRRNRCKKPFEKNRFKNLIWVCALFLSACHSLPHIFSTSHQQTHHKQLCHRSLSRFPASHYLRMQGQGSSITKATQSAQSEIARILSAQINSVIEVQASQSQDQSSESVHENIQISTHFKHAELIKSIPQCQVCTQSDQCSTWVTLSKQNLAQRIELNIADDLSRLNKAVQQINMQTPLLLFSQSWYQAHHIYQKLMPEINQLKVLGFMSPQMLTIERKMSLATSIQAKRFAQVRFLLHASSVHTQQDQAIHPFQNQLQSIIQAQLQKALGIWHLKPWKMSQCPKPHTTEAQIDVVQLYPHTHISCRLGFLGPQCHMNLSVAMSLCNQKFTRHDQNRIVQWKAVHPHHVNHAMRKLLQQIEGKNLKDLIYHSISPIIAL